MCLAVKTYSAKPTMLFPSPMRSCIFQMGHFSIARISAHSRPTYLHFKKKPIFLCAPAVAQNTSPIPRQLKPQNYKNTNSPKGHFTIFLHLPLSCALSSSTHPTQPHTPFPASPSSQTVKGGHFCDNVHVVIYQSTHISTTRPAIDL